MFVVGPFGRNAGEMNAFGTRIDSVRYSSALIPGRRSPANEAASERFGNSRKSAWLSGPV